MHTANAVDPSRRSSRLPVAVPILVTSLEPAAPFSEMCETLVVSAHGCAIRSSTRLDAGVPVRFLRKEGREATAHVVDCQPIGAGQQGWKVAARLDRPENFWGLKPCPQDWVPLPEMPAPAEQRLSRKLPTRNTEESLRAQNLRTRREPKPTHGRRCEGHSCGEYSLIAGRSDGAQAKADTRRAKTQSI